MNSLPRLSSRTASSSFPTSPDGAWKSTRPPSRRTPSDLRDHQLLRPPPRTPHHYRPPFCSSCPRQSRRANQPSVREKASRFMSPYRHLHKHEIYVRGAWMASSADDMAVAINAARTVKL